MDKSNKLVIVDQILEQLEAAKSGIVEGSVCMASVSAIDNVASNIVQNVIGGSTSGAYMTFPLSPIVKCCSLDKSYLNLEFVLNFNMEIAANPWAKADANSTITAEFPLFVGFRDTNTIFNQVQLMIENTPIYTDSYNRENATFLYCSLPEGVVRDGTQYANIDKMRNGEKSPMKRIVVKAKITHTSGTENPTKVCKARVSIPIKATVDVSRMPQVILSNLHYTTPHFGNLRLRTFIQRIEEALLFCPDYGWITTKGANAGDCLTPFCNQYWTYYSFNQAYEDSKNAAITNIPFYGYVTSDTTTTIANGTILVSTGFKFDNAEGIAQADAADGQLWSPSPFMTFNAGGCVAEMVQTCFDIKGEEYDKLTQYFEEMGSIIIPTQVLSASVFNTSTLSAGDIIGGSYIANVGSYNINDICVYFHKTRCPVMFDNEALTHFQLLLDGRPINNLPYSFLNDKAITQMTQSIIDTDHEDINRDYMRSLSWLNQTDTDAYLESALNTQFANGGTAGAIGSAIRRHGVYNPGLCAYVFNCNLDDAFHSGWACLETATRNAVLRFDCSSALGTSPFTTGRTAYPLYQTSNAGSNDSTTVGFICFCDTCLVLDYDKARGIATSGSLSNSAPYI